MNRVKNIRRNAARFQRSGARPPMVRPARRPAPTPTPATEHVDAGVVNFTAEEVAHVGAQALDIVDLAEMTRDDLRLIAKDLGIKGQGRMLKPALVEAIAATRAAQVAA